MLHDPEASEEQEVVYLWANDEYDATRQCELIAQRRNGRFDYVQMASNWRNKAGKKRYNCLITIFGEPSDADD